MEFDLDGNGDIGEKRVIWRSVQTWLEGGLSYSAPIQMLLERAQLPEEEEG